MNTILFKKGFTLIELIVALSLLSVIALGIFSINQVLSTNNQDYGQRYSIKSVTQITLNHILKNAALAVGLGGTDSFGNSQTGVLIGTAGVGDADSFCIHQDIPPGPYGAGSIDSATVNNPASAPPLYTNSRWLCYTWYPLSSAVYPGQIVYCTMPYTDTAAGSRGAASCGSGSVKAGPLSLGTAFSNPVVTFNTNNDGALDVTITNCLNNATSGTCAAGGTSTDPANNPEVQLSGSASSSQESF